MEDELIAAMKNLDEDAVVSYVQKLRENGTDSISIINTLNIGMIEVGKLFESRSYYLADLIVSGVIYQQALKLIEFEVSAGAETSAGKALIGVVKNDIHEIGKDIVAGTLRAEGFEVIDLGVDVDRGDFVRAVIEHKPQFLALSGTMSFAVDAMEEIIRSLEEAGLRKNLTIIVGGICVNKINARRIGADFYSRDPVEALAICKNLIKAELHEQG
jgi:methanogenic corrinoid protein MtbC1